MASVFVYVPRHGSELRREIVDASGIVGSPLEDTVGKMLIDYEGALYRQPGLKTYADKVAHAAERHVHRYATRARKIVDAGELVHIGFWDVERSSVIVLDEGYFRLCEWLGVKRIPQSELELSR